MKKNYFCAGVFVLLYAIAGGAVFAQDFGFGFDDEAGAQDSASRIAVNVSGEIAVELAPFVHDFKKEDGSGAISFWDMASASIGFSVAGKNAEAAAAFNINADAIRELWDASPNLGEPNYTPLIIGEAFLRGWVGPVDIEAGFRKITWGKADSLGPLDIVNPLDYTDLRNIADIQSIKIARPLAHISWNMDGFSKLEAVFIPNFAGHRFDQEGRWAPAQFGDMYSRAESGIFAIADAKYGDMLSNPLIASLV
ncbi:MAG: hypothetical protein LBI06_01395, partial [Treponema sp.]|nr:hypothetical protein [Treponema sp.]